MALRLSTGLRDALMEKKAVASVIKAAATTISFTANHILDSGNGLASTIRKGKVTVYGSGSNNGTFTVAAVAAGDITVVETLNVAGAGPAITLVQALGGSFSDLFRNCVMRIFAGTQPANADTAEGSTHLVEITLASGAFTPGSAANGLNFDDAIAGVLGKDALEVWSGVAGSSGTAGWFRVYDNSRTTGATTTGIAFDGAISTSGAQLNMSNTTITNGGTTTIDSGAVTIPTL